MQENMNKCINIHLHMHKFVYMYIHLRVHIDTNISSCICRYKWCTNSSYFLPQIGLPTSKYLKKISKDFLKTMAEHVNMCEFTYIYICTNMCIHLYIYTYTYAHVYTVVFQMICELWYIFEFWYICTSTYIYNHIYTYIYTMLFRLFHSIKDYFLKMQLVLHRAQHCNALQHTATHCNTLQVNYI